MPGRGARREPSGGASSACRVLVAEGIPAPGGELALLLRSAGCDVRVAGLGAECAATAAESGADIAILDPACLGPPGYAAIARRLREHQPSVGLVLLADRPSEQLLVNALRLGFDDVLVRPLAPSEALAAVSDLHQRVVERRRVAGPADPSTEDAARGTHYDRGVHEAAEAVFRALDPLRAAGARPGEPTASVAPALRGALSRAVAHLECLRPATSSLRERASVTQALSAAIRLAQSWHGPALEFAVRQRQAVPRPTMRPARLRAVLALLLDEAAAGAPTTGARRVMIDLWAEGSDALVCLHRGWTATGVPDEWAPLRRLAIAFARGALESLGGSLTRTSEGKGGDALEVRIPCDPRAPRDWGADLAEADGG